MLPNARLLMRAFHRVPPYSHAAPIRRYSPSSTNLKWEGRPAEENPSREPDTHNAQQDAVRDGKAERASGKGESSATSEKAGGAGHKDLNKKAKEDHPEAPGPVIGMNDERGGKGR